jgi:hypothetical protein
MMTARVGLGLLAGCLLSLLSLLPGKSTPLLPDDPYVPPRGYVCYRATSSITLDGDPSEPAWSAAPWSEPFVDIEGDRKPPPRFGTRVKMLWDDSALYVAAEIEEPHAWGTLTEHDSVIFHDNDFEVFLDPDGDSHLYGELELNALNTTWDLLLTKPYKDGGHAVNAWEVAGLRTAVRVLGTLNDPSDTDRGWTLEIAWPWKGLKELTRRKTPPSDGEQWRIDFSRVEWEHELAGGQYRKVAGRREDNWVWSPQGVIDMHRPERWGVLQFSTAVPGTSEYRPDPAGETRHLLHRVYYAQRAYQKQHGFWAASLERLGVSGPVRMEVTTNTFEASAVVPATGERWFLGSDGRVWKE